MEQKDAGGYKYYKCRSMLNSFSGGTVYDTSAKYDSSCYTKSILKNPVAKYKVEKADDTSLLDSTTHLDDDVFNDHNEQSNVADTNDNKIVYLVNTENLSNSECLSSQTENVDPQELIILSLNDFDTYVSQDCQEFRKTDECVKDLNSSLESFSYGTNRSLSQEDNSECSYVYYSTPEFINPNDVSSQEQSDSGCQNEGTKSVSVKKRSHKRKQTYIIKDDCFFELPSGDFDKLNAISLDNRSKKKKFASDKENQKRTLLYKHLNSVEPVKMNSILKSIKLVKNKNESINCSQKSETSSEECINFNSCIETDNLTSRKASVLSNHNSVTISSELTDPDYFEYVEPLEKIIESNMDKLVSPTVEVEDPKKMEILERELVHLKSLYAKKLGFKNIFNTSNDSIINEIFFGESLIYKNIKLDLVFVDNAKIISKDNHQDINKFFKPVSLLDSINDLKLFGGLTEEKCTEKSSDDENCQLVIDESKSLLKTKKNKTRKKSSNLSEVQLDCLKDKSVLDNFSLNCSSKSHLVEIKGNGISRECASNIQSEIKDQYSSIKIKIKKVSDEKNQYIIDGFNKQKSSNIKKKTVNKVINPVRYDCSFCLEKFKTKRLLKSHMSNFHKGPYDVECDICHMKFKKSSAYKKHHSWCEKSKEFPCPLCSKVYCYNGSLKKHLKSHEKNYKLKSNFTEDSKM